MLEAGAMDRPSLRSALRRTRATLAPDARREAEFAVLSRVAAQVGELAKQLARRPNCGLYLGQGSELNPEALLQWPGIAARWFAPVLTGPGLMKFCLIDASTPVQVNDLRFREPAPPHDGLLDAMALDVLYAPLVGFDRHGSRLGAGGGFYDRAVAARRSTPPPPWFIGLAFADQEVDCIERADWDVALDGVVTAGRVVWFGRRLDDSHGPHTPSNV